MELHILLKEDLFWRCTKLETRMEIVLFIEVYTLKLQ